MIKIPAKGLPERLRNAASAASLQGAWWTRWDLVHLAVEAAAELESRAPKEVSTRRRAKSGIVHEMANLGVDYLCGRTAQEPYNWTEEPVTCRQCLDALQPGDLDV